MEKINKKAKKNSKSKKINQPVVKVVYKTNPIKFKTSASEFRALVQELTGQDAADTAYSATSFSTEEDGVEEAVKVAEEGNVHAVLEEQLIKMGQPSGRVVELSEFDPMVGPTTIGSYYDSFVSSLMIDGFLELGSNLVDVLTSVDAL